MAAGLPARGRRQIGVAGPGDEGGVREHHFAPIPLAAPPLSSCSPPPAWRVAWTDAGSIFSNSTIYPKLPAWHPDALAFVMMGDLHYSDIGQENPALYRAASEGVLAQPNVQTLMLKRPIIYQPDDHDYGPNNPTRLSSGIAAFQAVYGQCVPSYPLPSATGLLYQSVQIGSSLLIVSDL